jgi:hypothetical protein
MWIFETEVKWVLNKIGRIFVYWAIVYFGRFFRNYRSNPNFFGYFFHGTYKLCIDFDQKMGNVIYIGHILGDFLHSAVLKNGLCMEGQTENLHPWGKNFNHRGQSSPRGATSPWVKRPPLGARLRTGLSFKEKYLERISSFSTAVR